MSYQDPNQPQGQQPNSGGQYGGGYTPPQQPQSTDPYSGQQPGYQQPGPGYQQPNYQQPGYQQPGYQQSPYGQGPAGGTGPSTMNIEPNLAAGLSYLFLWVGGLIFFLLEKRNRFVRFNAMQSILLTGAYTALVIIVNVAFAVLPGLLALGLTCLSSIAGIAFFIFWIICMINAFQGKYYKLPLIGDYAERYANQGIIN